MKKYLLLIAILFNVIPSQAADAATSDAAATDTERRTVIKSFVDSMPGYFEKKDMQSISALFSDDILIVTDGPLMRKQSYHAWQPRNGKKIDSRYRAEYINNLRKLFRTSQQVSAVADNVAITRSGTTPDIYGATVHLTVEAGPYKDGGWMFFVWDFAAPERPQIIVRTWQPDNIISDKSQIITLSDFYTPTR